MISAIDLFCGAGGLTSGLKRAGVHVGAGVDFDGSCKFAFEKNNNATFLHEDIKNIRADDVRKYFKPKTRTLIAGCAPCQPFSTYTQGRDTTSDPKWGLLSEFARLVREVQPDFVTMENVSSLARHTIFDDFKKMLEAENYEVKQGVLNCVEFGLPQTRERLVLIASRSGVVKFPVPTKHRATVRETIGSLPPIVDGQTDMRDSLHRAATLSPLNLKRIKASVPGGTWKSWPKSLRADCHQKESGKTYPSVYGRMCWDLPAPTITTQCYGFGNGRFGHPEQHRAISLREASLLQSFSADYQFTAKGDPVPFKTVGRMIGNAVPPLIGELVGAVLMEAAG